MERNRISIFVASACTALVALAGCAVSGGDPDTTAPSTAGAPSQELAVKASAPSSTQERPRRSGRSKRPKSSATPSTTVSTSSDKGSRAPAAAAQGRRLASVSDDVGDAGPETPGYADIKAIHVYDAGTKVRVAVTMSGSIPKRLPRGEVEGVGIDLIRDGGDYQLFASGQRDGWYGYLYTPEGFVRYRGSLEIAGRSLIFTVSWDEVGGKGPGSTGGFADWSGRGRVGENPFSQDVAPETGADPWRE